MSRPFNGSFNGSAAAVCSALDKLEHFSKSASSPNSLKKVPLFLPEEGEMELELKHPGPNAIFFSFYVLVSLKLNIVFLFADHSIKASISAHIDSQQLSN